MSLLQTILSDIVRCTVRFRTGRLADVGLKACHASLLVPICDHPGITQDALARIVCINKSNVARQSVVLEQEGYILRIPGVEDKRLMQLFPTQQALTLLPRLRELACQWEDQLTGTLSDSEIQQLKALLQKVRSQAVEALEDE